jgi:cysteine desulfurase
VKRVPVDDAVYLDYAAAAPLDPRVASVMAACLGDPALQANPASTHAAGREAAEQVAAARARVARLVNAEPEAIVFTSGATESVNLAVLGAARAAGKDRRSFWALIQKHEIDVERYRASAPSGPPRSARSPQSTLS